MGEAENEDLDALMRRVDPDRWLSSRFIGDLAQREDVIALYAYDHELARAPQVASNALLGEIRLTWWREALDEIYEGRPARHHPAVQALARAVARRKLPREALDAMNDARYRELDATPMSETEALDWACDTGGKAAELAVRILDPAADPALAMAAGAAWSLGILCRVDETKQLVLQRTLTAGRSAVRSLSVAAFPAVAHATLAGRAEPSELAKRLRITLAVARGRI